MRTYTRLLRRPATALSLLAALLGAIPIGMWPLAIVLGVLARGGGAAEAGLLAAVFGAGNAIGVLTQGVLLLRVGASRLLPPFAAGAIAAAVLLQQTGTAVIAGAALAGVAIPAITPAVRGRLAVTLPGEDRPGAYALVNVLFQAGVAIGPVAVAMLAASGLVGIAAPFAAAAGIVSTALLAVAQRGGTSPGWEPRPDERGRSASRGGVPVLLAVSIAAGFGIGVLQVLVPLRSPVGVAGAAFAVLALAEVAGAVLLGGRARVRHAGRLLIAGTAAMAAAYALFGAGVATVVLVTASLGVATAVQSLGSAVSLDRFVSARRLPAVFATQVAVLLVGTSVGSLVAGVAPEAAPFVAAGLLAVAAAAATLLPRDRSAARPAAPHGRPLLRTP